MELLHPPCIKLSVVPLHKGSKMTLKKVQEGYHFEFWVANWKFSFASCTVLGTTCPSSLKPFPSWVDNLFFQTMVATIRRTPSHFQLLCTHYIRLEVVTSSGKTWSFPLYSYGVYTFSTIPFVSQQASNTMIELEQHFRNTAPKYTKLN